MVEEEGEVVSDFLRPLQYSVRIQLFPFAPSLVFFVQYYWQLALSDGPTFLHWSFVFVLI